MFRNGLSNRAILAGIVFFVAIVSTSLLYSWHIHNTGKAELELTKQHVQHLTETQTHTQTATKPPQSETTESGLWHGDESHTVSHKVTETPDINERTSDTPETHEPHPHDLLSEAEHQRLHAELRAEVEQKKAERQEMRKAMSDITNQLKAIESEYRNVYTMTPQEFLAMTNTEQKHFLGRAHKFDLAINEVKEQIVATPQWMWEHVGKKHPDLKARLVTIPSIYGLFRRLQ